jgi:probable rRNA maturation factor
MAITFQTQEIKFILPEKTRIRKWINAIIEKEKKRPGQLNFLLTTDKEVLKRNKEFLDHDTLTDIITFDYTVDGIISGDIIISIERVSENARKFKVDLNNELMRVMIHGILHLCGFRDKTSSEKIAMRNAEDKALKIYSKMLSQ